MSPLSRSKILTFFLAIVAMPAASLADSMTCTIRPLKASSTGLIPVADEDAIELTTPISPPSNGSTKGATRACAQGEKLGFKIELCATESDFIGGFDVSVSAWSGRDWPTVGTVLFGSSRDEKSPLVPLLATDRVIESVQNKLSKGRINTPSTLTGDSSAMNESIRRAMEKGLLSKDAVIVVGIDLEKSCRLIKR